MAKKMIVTCDVCKNEIATSETSDKAAAPWLDAGVYGVEAHISCFEDLPAILVVRLLGLDDIRLVRSDGEFEKYIYSARVKAAR